jgi:hypothetical protein
MFARFARHARTFAIALLAVLHVASAFADEPGLTTLTNPDLPYTVPELHYVVLERGDVRAVVVDNAAVDDEVLPGHRAGYSGLGSLTHTRRAENLFVPEVSGLNFEHIHDGTTQERPILFEPRNAPMELRRVGEHAVELYQAPTPHWGLESSSRYELGEDGVIALTVEFIARRPTFANGYIGLFWASYIHQPESLDIHFRGLENGTGPETWVRGVTPEHGTLATHLAVDDERQPAHDADFPLSLVFGLSRHRYVQPWYYGVSHGMAYAQVFRPEDRVRITQSPSGGGAGNPAWDFQIFVEDYELNRPYRMVMRAMYLPYESPEQMVQDVFPPP